MLAWHNLLFLDPSPPLELKLCVAVKRKLQVRVTFLVMSTGDCVLYCGHPCRADTCSAGT